MRVVIVLAIILGVCVWIARAYSTSNPVGRGAGGGGTGDHVWHTTWEAVAAKAIASKRPILADFTGSDWCGWCIKLKEEVFDTPEFESWAARTVVLLEIDFPKNKSQSQEDKIANTQLAQKYGIKGFPTILLLNPDVTVIGKLGYRSGGAKTWIQAAEDVIAKGG